MSPRRPSTGRLAIVIAAFAIAVVDLVTAVHLATSAPAPAGDRVPGRVAVSSPTPAPAASPSPVTTPAPATPAPAAPAQPARLQLPNIGVDAPVEAVGATPQNTMDVPRNVQDVGWYAPGVRPGQPGDAVIDGHLDWYTGPAVFVNLARLQVGDRVVIVLSDGSALAFRVTRLASYPVDRPPADLFSRDGPPRLSLITCSGAWDGHEYQRRLVVDAEPV